MKCAICGKEIKRAGIKDYCGNNPYPVRTDENARCCDECNDKYVLPFRILFIGITDKEQLQDMIGVLNNLSTEHLDTILALRGDTNEND